MLIKGENILNYVYSPVGDSEPKHSLLRAGPGRIN